MKILFLILGLVNADGTLELIKIPITHGIKHISCNKAFENHTKWQENPNYVEGNGQIYGFNTYKDKPIALHICSERVVDGE